LDLIFTYGFIASLLLMVADDRRPDSASHDYYIIQERGLSVKLVIFTKQNIKPY